MPSTLDVTQEPRQRKLPRAPEDRPLPARNLCTLCMYNIPSGSLMVLIPGLVMLLTGIVVMSWTNLDTSWNGDLTSVSLIFLIIGGLLTLSAVIYWTTMWCKYRPKVTNNRRSISPRVDQPVQLVAVRHKRNPQEKYEAPPPGERISTIT